MINVIRSDLLSFAVVIKRDLPSFNIIEHDFRDLLCLNVNGCDYVWFDVIERDWVWFAALYWD